MNLIKLLRSLIKKNEIWNRGVSKQPFWCLDNAQASVSSLWPLLHNASVERYIFQWQCNVPFNQASVQPPTWFTWMQPLLAVNLVNHSIIMQCLSDKIAIHIAHRCASKLAKTRGKKLQQNNKKWFTECQDIGHRHCSSQWEQWRSWIIDENGVWFQERKKKKN